MSQANLAGVLTLEQDLQLITGTLEISGIFLPVEHGRLHGNNISFTINRVDYTGRINGDIMEGVSKGRTTHTWAATRWRE
jgi:hypothetical protein